jgi:hypothetical protein
VPGDRRQRDEPGPVGRLDLEHQRRAVGAQRGGDALPWQRPVAGGEVQVQPQRVHARGVELVAAGAEVVVQVEQDDVAGDRAQDRFDPEAAERGGQVRVAEVEEHPDAGGVHRADEVADADRVVREARGPRPDRRQVLHGDRDAQRGGALAVRAQRALLGEGARGDALVHAAVVAPVVGDELGAGLVGVAEQAADGAVAGQGAGAEVVGPVDEQAQPARVERGAQGARVAAALLPVGEDRRGRRVDLDPGEPGGLDGLQRRRGGPVVAVDVEAEALVDGAGLHLQRVLIVHGRSVPARAPDRVKKS